MSSASLHELVVIGRLEGDCRDREIGTCASFSRQGGHIELRNGFWSNKRFIMCAGIVEDESSYPRSLPH